MIGKYRIVRRLGRGGEGSVYLALHCQTQQLWAIKEFADCDEHSVHELRMLRRLRHSCLPAIIDVIAANGNVYLVMEYIRGKSLEQIVREKGSLPLQQVTAIAVSLCSALDYLHKRPEKILHLDVKPANVILTGRGRLMLVDFGAALFQKETAAARRKGTGGYASPEQYQRGVTLDERSDLYSLGALLYQLISGVRYSPFLYKSRIPGCPEAFEVIIRRCLCEDREKRYGSCRELYEELYRMKERMYRQKHRTLLWAAVLTVIVAGASAYYGISGQLEEKVEVTFNYEELLQEAACSDLPEAMYYYRQAVFLEPGQGSAYLQLLRTMDADGRFDAEEDVLIRNLLHTIPYGSDRTNEEILSEHAQEYGKVACMLGLMYWFEYDQGNGKRIASGWFQKAAEQAEKSGRKEGWTKAAAVLAVMSSYEQTGISEAFPQETGKADYLGSLKQILVPDLMGQMDEEIRLQLCIEGLSKIAGSMHRMVRNRSDLEDLEEVINRLERFGSSLQGDAADGAETEVGRSTALLQKRDQLLLQCKELLSNMTQQYSVTEQGGTG